MFGTPQFRPSLMVKFVTISSYFRLYNNLPSTVGTIVFMFSQIDYSPFHTEDKPFKMPNLIKVRCNIIEIGNCEVIFSSIISMLLNNRNIMMGDKTSTNQKSMTKLRFL